MHHRTITWKSQLSAIVFAAALTSCRQPDQSPKLLPLEGTWELLSEIIIEKGDTTFTPAATTQRMIKIINKTHFSFLRHNLNASGDSTLAFIAGGGTYSLTGNIYKEHLEFFGNREWENHDFSFVVEIRDDTLIQKGQEKIEGTDIDRLIVEKYRRVEK
ncbi:MAG: hypothetical protein ABI477_18290 [Chryseolinea sp.]